jgi:hypothetical protein
MGHVMDQAVHKTGKINLESRMAAVGPGMILAEYANENISGGLASFLQDNLLFSEVNHT